ncbi:myosin heavy chain, striated muscle-like [Engraulis encrasicolus]|uniref:myosin heavy chain, striated muscle-like n=1 Tax=Engraulis encrasicolus TaxID=184585 RepID=UPI002FD7153C
MKASVAVWVLLCCCMTETQGRGDLARQKDTSPEGSPDWTPEAAQASSQQVAEPDIHTVLREMSVKIAQQEVELRCTKTQVEDMQTRLRDSESKAEAVETRLRDSESKAEAVETRLRDSERIIEGQRVELKYTMAQVQALETRLRVSESKVDVVETRLKASESKVEDLETRLRASEKTIEEQRDVIKELREAQEEQTAALGAVGDGLNLTGSQVEELRMEREESRVSFSTSLTSTGEVTIGPYSDNLPILVYKHVFSNMGNAYNPHTGIFTAPVRGMYHFVFFVHGIGHASVATAVSLHKNEEHIALAYAHQPSHNMTPSNGVSLLLEVGDVVYLKLWSSAWVYDSYHHQSTFSGHLLFQL